MNLLLRAVTAAAVATALVAPRAFAQDATPAAPGAPATTPVLPPVPAVTAPTNAPVVPPVSGEITTPPSTNKAPAKSAAKSPTTKKPVAKSEPKQEQKVDAITSPTAGVAKGNVNIRGQASINSEAIGKLKKGDSVTLLETVTLKKPKQDEPSQWYRIALPSAISVWVNSSFIDANGAVKANRLNMRGGPGENYSIVGRLEKGASVKTLDTKSGWTKIEPPTNAFAFVAAHLVERQAAPAIAAVDTKPATVEPVPAPTVPPVTTAPVATTTPPTIAETAPIAPAPVPVPAPAETATPATNTPAPVEAEAAPIEKVRKIVTREGTLKGTVSIQAPAYFELRSLDTGKAIAYLYSSNTNLVLKQYKGQRIIATGEEVLDERWQHTPVMVIDELQVVR